MQNFVIGNVKMAQNGYNKRRKPSCKQDFTKVMMSTLRGKR